MFGVVAGSYVAYLAREVKEYRDVDVFIVVTRENLEIFQTCYETYLGADPLWDEYDQRCGSGKILKVMEFGKVQLIISPPLDITEELNIVKKHLSEELGVTFSLAKLIEHLAKEKTKALKLNGSAKNCTKKIVKSCN